MELPVPDRPASEPVDLLAVARELAGAAGPGEQIEAYALRSRDTEVKVFGGEVESLSVAEIDGVGVRVVVDHRTGYAWAGSLAPEVVADTLAEARDNAAFGAPDEHAGLAAPSDFAGVEVPALDLWRDELLAVPAADKVALALEVERATLAADDRVRGVESADYGDAAIEAAVANSLGVEASSRRCVASVAASAMAGDRDDTQTGTGFSVGRTTAELDIERGLAGCRAALDPVARRGPTVVASAPGDPRPPREPLDPRPHRFGAERRGDRQGPVDVPRARGRAGRCADGEPDRRSHDPRRVRRRDP